MEMLVWTVQHSCRENEDGWMEPLGYRDLDLIEVASHTPFVVSAYFWSSAPPCQDKDNKTLGLN